MRQIRWIGVLGLPFLLFAAGCATIYTAARDGDLPTVQTLVTQGADVNAVNENGSTALHVAADRGRTEVVRFLLNHGASVNIKAKSGSTPLLLAAQSGSLETVRILLDHGAEVNVETGEGKGHINWTPLTVAVEANSLELVQLLLSKGADPNLPDDPTIAPLGHAARKNNREMASLLLEHKARAGKEYALRMMALHGDVETVRLLLDQGADVNDPRVTNWTALKEAAWGNDAGKQLRVIQLLLERGADPTAVDDQGWTAAQWAEYRGKPALAKVLREAEARAAKAGPAAPTTATPPVPASDVDRLPTAKATRKKYAYAVVIGIEQYREKLPRADFAARDATLMGEYLTKVLGYPEENVVVQVNERATGKDLEKYFENWLPNNVEKDGSVFVYYSGHGAPNPKTSDAYLVPYDGDPTFIESTGYPLKRLYAALEKLPAKDITVVLDSCFSGAGGRSVLAKGARPMVLSVENTVLAGGKTVVLAASSGAQISSTFEEQGHGLLTYFFLKGLQGEADLNHDGTIDLTELFEYVKPNVQKIARKQYNNEQTPQLLASPELLRKGGGRLIEPPSSSR
ncbi:MAG: ankyrin repeat domain-containing protein [Nitrospirota bacterium]|nr:ankyrin repeat domain-containing protein [Nitrospirota bacterium]